MGGSFFLGEGMLILSVIVHNLDVIGVAISPMETYSPLIVDSDTVLPGPVSFQRFQPIPANLCQVVQAGRCMEASQPRTSSGFDRTESTAAEPSVKRLGFLALKREDHLHLT